MPDLPLNSTQVYLASNQIKQLKVNDFAECFVVKTIELQSNLLEHIEPDSFADCKRLETLILRGNVIDFDEVSADAFNGLQSLAKLEISNNRWTEKSKYRGDIISKLQSLIELHIDGISSIPFPKEYANLTKLRTLAIDNGITAVKNETFAVFEKHRLTKLLINSVSTLQALEPMSFAHF